MQKIVNDNTITFKFYLIIFENILNQKNLDTQNIYKQLNLLSLSYILETRKRKARSLLSFIRTSFENDDNFILKVLNEKNEFIKRMILSPDFTMKESNMSHDILDDLENKDLKKLAKDQNLKYQAALSIDDIESNVNLNPEKENLEISHLWAKGKGASIFYKKIKDDFKDYFINVKLDAPKYTLPNFKTLEKKESLNIIYASDFHIGFKSVLNSLKSTHDTKSLSILLEYIKDTSPDIVVLGGDLLDLSEFSTYDKNPNERRTTSYAIMELQYFLSVLRDILPNSFIFYLEGNHEDRVERNIKKYIPELYEIPSKNILETGQKSKSFLEEKLDLESLQISYIRYPKHLTIGNTVFTHGKKLNPQNILKTMSGQTEIMGHIHKFTINCQTSFDAKHTPIYSQICSSGTFAKLDESLPSVTDRMNWQQVFLHITNDNKNSLVLPLFIKDHSLLGKTKTYKGKDYTKTSSYKSFIKSYENALKDAFEKEDNFVVEKDFNTLLKEVSKINP